jgi:thioredoxin reductase (NADPH)
VAGSSLRETKPVIVALDEPTGLSVVADALMSRYAADYAIVTEHSADAALARLRELAERGTEVALILGARDIGGAEFLAAAHPLHPHARRGLLLDWGEHRAAREDIVRSLDLGQADYLLGKPLASPDERFHRAVTEFLDEWWRLRGSPFEVVRIIGDEHSPRIHEVCDLLQRHDFPYGFYAVDSDEARTLLDEAGASADQIPVVILLSGQTFVDPTNVEVAEALGARTQAGVGIYDVAIVGAGPAGLASAVYAGSEGLRTSLIERWAMGGQAGTSSMIRNYLGFPRGISGAELASRAFDQAMLFGADMVYGGDAVSLRLEGDLRVIGLANGSEVTARTVVVATGVSYRVLGNPELEPFHGVGVFYGAAISEARALAGEHVFVVGGGNSAGQAALYLARFASQVSMIVRSDTLSHSMSEYLITDIQATRNIDVRYGVDIAGGGGDARLNSLDLRDRNTGVIEKTPAAALFVLIGAQPLTEWLPDSVARDQGGYLMTGPSCSCNSCSATTPSNRLLYETTTPGVFAVGDVRHASVKRVASAAGEGAVCVRLIHEYLSQLPVSALDLDFEAARFAAHDGAGADCHGAAG